MHFRRLKNYCASAKITSALEDILHQLKVYFIKCLNHFCVCAIIIYINMISVISTTSQSEFGVTPLFTYKLLKLYILRNE